MFLRTPYYILKLLFIYLGGVIPLAGQSASSEIYVQHGPESVRALAVSPDSRLLATGDGGVGGAEVQLYDLQAGREIGHLAHSQVRGLSLSPDAHTNAARLLPTRTVLRAPVHHRSHAVSPTRSAACARKPRVKL